MDRDTVAFGVPLGGLVLGMAIMLAGIYQGGLTGTTFAGLAVGLLAITGFVVAVRVTA